MQSVQTDVLVIGGGAAGLLAALEARKLGCAVLLTVKGIPEESCTHYDGCDFRMQVDETSGEQLGHVQLEETGEGMCDTRIAERVLTEAPAKVLSLREYGLPIKMFRPLGQKATGYLVDSTQISSVFHGTTLEMVLLQAVEKSGIRLARNWLVYRLLKRDDRVVGALALAPDGEWYAISAKVTVLAAGNAGHIFERTNCPPGCTGDGYSLALRAGASLINMEFLRYFGVGLIGSSFPYQRTAPPVMRVPGGRVSNEDGEDLCQKWFGMPLREAFELPTGKYEGLTKMVATEGKRGEVYVDFTRVKAEDWENVLAPSLYCQEFVRRAPVDLLREPVPIAPLAYANFGGVRINQDTETGIPGLLATGRVAGGYMGAQATVPRFTFVVASVVLGPVSGRKAATEACETSQPVLEDTQCRAEMEEVRRYAQGAGGKERAADLYAELRRAMWHAAGPIRSDKGLVEGLTSVAGLQQELARASTQDPADLRALLELENALLAGEIILRTALMRTETRGIHLREDYPEKNDAKWLKWITVNMEKGQKITLGVDNTPSQALKNE